MEASSVEVAAPAATRTPALGAADGRGETASSVVRLARVAALPVAVAAAVFGLAFSNGTYGVTARDSVAIGVWWLLALCIGTAAMPVARVPRAALSAAAFLAGFAVLSGASIAWSASAENAFDQMNRGLLYLAIFTVVALGARRASAARWSDGLAMGIAALALFALAARLFPHLIPSANTSAIFPNDPRPSYPVNYWNGLAILVGLGFPPLLRAATFASRRWTRALALAPLPALAAVIYLTSSRGGTVTTVLAALAFVILTSRRAAAAVALAVAAAGSVVVVEVLHRSPHIVNGPLGSSQAASEGSHAALLIVAVCVVTAFAYLLVQRVRIPRAPRVSQGVAVLVGLAVVVALTAGIVGADPYKRFQSFKKPPQSYAGGNYTASHLASGAGNGRWQFWQAAFDQFKSKPLAGGGAGSYEAYWAKHGTIDYFVRDAHSLYLQTLGELGIGGFLLLVGFFGSVLFAARRRLAAARGPDRAAVASIAAVAIAVSFAFAIDWMWQLTVVGAIGVAAFALLTGPSTEFGSESVKRRLTARGRFVARAVGVGLAFTAIAGLAIPLLAQTDVRASQQSAAKGNRAAALSHALDARRWQPWAASTQLQVALAQKDAGQLSAAKASIAKAIQGDPSDWRLFVVSAQIQNAVGHPRAAKADLHHAKSMSPHAAALASVQ